MNPLEIESALDACTPPAPEAAEAVASFSTGSLGLDAVLHPRGWPKRAISRIAGEPMTGKTTLLYHAIASAQKSGLTVALGDFHYSFNPDYAKSLGVMLYELVVADSWVLLHHEVPVDVLAIDGISNQEQADAVGWAARGKTVIAAVQRGTYRTPAVPRTAVSVRLRAGKPVSGGVTVQAEVTQDEYGPPNYVGGINMAQTGFQIRYGTGIDVFDELLNLGVLCGAVQLTGSWYDFGSGHGIQGRENAAFVLSTIPALAAGITEAVKASWTPAR